MKTIPLSMIFAAVFVAGCEDTSNGSDTIAQQRQSYNELVATFDEIDDKFEVDNFDQASDPATLPTTGGAFYTGVLGANLPNGTLLGQLNLTASFQDSNMSGSVRNFVDENEVEYAGELAISNGNIDRTTVLSETFTFAAVVAGDLNSDTAGNINFDTVMNGDFYGANQDYIAGNVTGTVTADGVATTLDGTESFFRGEK